MAGVVAKGRGKKEKKDCEKKLVFAARGNGGQSQQGGGPRDIKERTRMPIARARRRKWQRTQAFLFLGGARTHEPTSHVSKI